MTTYRLSTRELGPDAGIAIVGCGGTGGFVAEGVCRLLGDRDIQVLLIDHDRVEERNLGRQAFYKSDLGKFKSQALAERLSRLYGRQIMYSVYPFNRDIITDVFTVRYYGSGLNGLIIGAVDNATARKSIAEAARGGYWIDVGNGEHSGQVLIGNSSDPEELKDSFYPEDGIVTRLPLPTVQQPALLAPPTQPVEEDMSCAEGVEANLQSPVINQAMATLVLEMVRRLLAGTLDYMAAYLDLEVGTLRYIPAEPEAVARMVGLQVNQLISNSKSNIAGGIIYESA